MIFAGLGICMPPTWFVVLAGFLSVAALYALPHERAKYLTDIFVHSEAAKLVAGLAGVIAFLVVLATAYQINEDITDRVAERSMRREEAISRAWERLLVRAAGNTGKGDALTLLFREGAKLDNVDLSCRAVGDWQEGRCNRPPIFAGVQIAGAAKPFAGTFDWGRFLLEFKFLDWLRPDGTLRDAIDLNGATINGFQIVGRGRENFSFVGAFVEDFVVKRSTVGLSVDDKTFISSAAFLDSTVKLFGPSLPAFSNVNVSGAIVDWLPKVPDDEIRTFLFWADWPPMRRRPDKFSVVDTVAPLFEMQLLAKMRACEPPLDREDKPVPRDARPDFFPCKEMSIPDAVRRFPDAYRPPAPSAYIYTSPFSAPQPDMGTR